MDQTVVDVTNIAGINVGDEVAIMGKQGKMEITADDLAQKLGTINYEVVAKIASRVTRTYIRN